MERTRTKEQWVQWILNSAALSEVTEDKREWAETRITQALDAIEKDGYGEGIED